MIILLKHLYTANAAAGIGLYAEQVTPGIIPGISIRYLCFAFLLNTS